MINPSDLTALIALAAGAIYAKRPPTAADRRATDRQYGHLPSQDRHAQ